jgi:hypothetical protein
MDKSLLMQLKLLRDLQGQTGTIDQGPYMVGLYNGLELAISIIEDRDPVFKCTEPSMKRICKDFLNELQDDSLLIGY